MRLKDVADMEDYLENRCYCPNEIYDISGFFYELFYPETKCKLLASGTKGAIHGYFVTATPERIGTVEPKKQIIYIETTNDTVDSCVRLDDTPNNRKQITSFMDGLIDKMSFDEYEQWSTQKALNEMMSMADAICIS